MQDDIGGVDADGAGGAKDGDAAGNNLLQPVPADLAGGGDGLKDFYRLKQGAFTNGLRTGGLKLRSENQQRHQRRGGEGGNRSRSSAPPWPGDQAARIARIAEAALDIRLEEVAGMHHHAEDQREEESQQRVETKHRDVEGDKSPPPSGCRRWCRPRSCLALASTEGPQLPAADQPFAEDQRAVCRCPRRSGTSPAPRWRRAAPRPAIPPATGGECRYRARPRHAENGLSRCRRPSSQAMTAPAARKPKPASFWCNSSAVTLRAMATAVTSVWLCAAGPFVATPRPRTRRCHSRAAGDAGQHGGRSEPHRMLEDQDDSNRREEEAEQNPEQPLAGGSGQPVMLLRHAHATASVLMAPKRRSRWAKVSSASISWVRPKSGHSTSRNSISA